MELLETQDPEKKRLIETSDRHRQEMERDLRDLSDRTESVLKNALVIGGALALTYLLVTQLSSTKKRKSKKADVDELETEANETPSMLTQVGDKVLNVATIFLLDLAKEKLSEYLQNRKTKHEDS